MKLQCNRLLCILVLLLPVLTGCLPSRNNPNDPLSSEYRLSGIPSPASGSTISGHDTIVITFDAPMNTGTLAFDATENFIPANATKAWSTSKYANDTYTISVNTTTPRVFWPKGSGMVMKYTCETADGVLISETYTYNVVYRVYVNNTTGGAALPDYTGTKAKPFSVVQTAVTFAQTLITGTAYSAETSEVYVAEGTYQANYYSTGTPVINMIEGISVYGGFSKSNWARDSASYETILVDTSTTGGGDYTSANRVVTSNSITNTTILDGFTITTAGLGYSAGIVCSSSSPTLSHNSIIGSATTYGAGSIYGIISTDGSPIISSNAIFEEWTNNKALESNGLYLSGSGTSTISSNSIYGGKATTTTAIYAGNTATITNNTIYANSSGSIPDQTTSYGILVVTASPTIENNTRIDCGNGSTQAICIRLNGTSTPAINSNILSNINKATDYAFAIYEAVAAADPTSVTSNDFDGFFGAGGTNTGYYYDYGNTTPIIISLTGNIINSTTNSLSGWSNTSTFTSN